MKNKKEVQNQIDIVMEEMTKLGGMMERFSYQQKELCGARKVLEYWKEVGIDLEKEFKPITIILKTQEEVNALFGVLNHTDVCNVHISLYKLWHKLYKAMSSLEYYHKFHDILNQPELLNGNTNTRSNVTTDTELISSE